MRGKVTPPSVVVLSGGITPAYAGKRPRVLTTAAAGQDHPRLCGEKSVQFMRVPACLGSPPPMRGKVLMMLHTPFCTGITPAYAGKREFCNDLVHVI